MSRSAAISVQRTKPDQSRAWLQRKCACGSAVSMNHKCPDCERRKGLDLQARLAIGDSQDPLEREADRTADIVLATQDPQEPVSVQRMPAAPERISTMRSPHMPDSVGTVLSKVGSPMNSALRHDMERRFGHDFSEVRIHVGADASRSARDLGAQAWTVGNHITFGAGRFAPDDQRGRRLIAHELTHVLQQSAAAKPLVQRDLAIEPQETNPVERHLTDQDVEDAIRFNRRQFDDPYTFAVMRDVIGVSRFPGVSDRTLALGVARWQAQHGVAQDGKLGPVTVTYVVEELQAEGNDADAALVMADFPHRALLDVTSAFCGCIPRLEREIQDSNFFIEEYSACGADPANTTGARIEDCIRSRAASRGDAIVTSGSTSASGTVRVAPVAGPCGPLEERLTLAHEQIHAVHTRGLQQTHGRGTRRFLRAFNDADDWVADEINARRTDIAVANWMIEVLGRACL